MMSSDSSDAIIYDDWILRSKANGQEPEILSNYLDLAINKLKA
jgi:hypothetical protein